MTLSKKTSILTIIYIFKLIINILISLNCVKSETIMEKIKNDSNVSKTYELLEKSTTLNKYLTNMTKGKLTFFVPSNEAWTNLQLDWTSTLKKIFEEEYYSSRLLERHLVWDKKDVWDTKKLATNKGVHKLLTLRDKIYLEFHDNKTMEWRRDNMKYLIAVKFEKTDVECSDGIYHVIDLPLLAGGDIKVSYGSSNIGPTINIILFLCCILSSIL